MKKLLSLLCVLLMMSVFTSCSLDEFFGEDEEIMQIEEQNGTSVEVVSISELDQYQDVVAHDLLAVMDVIVVKIGIANVILHDRDNSTATITFTSPNGDSTKLNYNATDRKYEASPLNVNVGDVYTVQVSLNGINYLGYVTAKLLSN